LDILVRATPDNGARVFAALAAFGAPLQAHGVTADIFTKTGYGYRMGVKPNLIEVLTSISGVSFAEAWQERREIDIDGRGIPVIGRSALLRNKQAANRPKDQADVAQLVAYAADHD
jgi:hypothetical protein